MRVIRLRVITVSFRLIDSHLLQLALTTYFYLPCGKVTTGRQISLSILGGIHWGTRYFTHPVSPLPKIPPGQVSKQATFPFQKQTSKMDCITQAMSCMGVPLASSTLG